LFICLAVQGIEFRNYKFSTIWTASLILFALVYFLDRACVFALGLPWTCYVHFPSGCEYRYLSLCLTFLLRLFKVMGGTTWTSKNL
jgi:hypothetical protein